MAPTSRPKHHLDLGSLPPLFPGQPRSGTSTGASSPVDPNPSGYGRTSQPVTGALGSLAGLNTPRHGAGSPSHEYGSRLYPRRARELQTAEGIAPQVWGPPVASGLSTPLRETIPESPVDDNDTFPDLGSQMLDNYKLQMQTSTTRRARAGTVPSKFPPGLVPPVQTSISSRPTPSGSPFRPGTVSVPEAAEAGDVRLPSGSTLLSRLRAGSLPQRANPPPLHSPFGPSVFSTGWNNGRERTSTMDSVQSDNFQRRPLAQHKDSLTDVDVKTLDYLGLVDSPGATTTLDQGILEQRYPSSSQIPQPLLANLAALDKMANSRFRSYSVNAKERYAAEEVDENEYYSGNQTPSAEATAAAVAATQAQIHQHNLEVQAYANQASANRPRARTAGILDTPASRIWRNYGANQAQIDVINAGGSQIEEDHEYSGLIDAVQALQLPSNLAVPQPKLDTPDTGILEEATRALWLGNIPPSITPSSLKVVFEPFGKIDSARILTHKSCGFVNFEFVESAVLAKARFNGKEIFPGAGPVRIGYAKAPSGTGTPQANGGAAASPTLESQIISTQERNRVAGESVRPAQANVLERDIVETELSIPLLVNIKPDIASIAGEFGADPSERTKIVEMVNHADALVMQPVVSLMGQEANPARMHDAPRLREIRKRIDNNSCTQSEIENIAMTMLPEIAELSSDYLGNTVVQKLFEHCNEEVKDMMLTAIAPHLAEIGMHKNGTWAAQKIIDVARTTNQMSLIVENLTPFGVSSFLDQYGNYVMQCCLRFQAPWNNFIFEVMLKNIWEISQGRFGARAMRACLESHHATKDQQRMMAAAIAIHGVQMSTNTNSALLLTWFLDTCTFPRRRTVLAPRMVPHLALLCTHKVAYLTVLKIINQRVEPEARDIILQALFFSPEDKILRDILLDQNCGATLVFKTLTTPFFDENIRFDVIQNVRKILVDIKAQPSQGYKRLMDEVGLSTRIGSNEPNNVGALQSGQQLLPQGMPSGLPQQDIVGSDNFLNMQGRHGGGYPAQSARGGMMDVKVNPEGFGVTSSENLNMYAQNVNSAAMNHVHSQGVSYQPTHGVQRPTGPYNYPSQVMNGFHNQAAAPFDPYRNIPRNAAMQQQQQLSFGPNPNSLAPQFNRPGGYNPMSANNPPAQMWPQYPPQYMMQHQHMSGQPMMGGGWRGRR